VRPNLNPKACYPSFPWYKRGASHLLAPLCSPGRPSSRQPLSCPFCSLARSAAAGHGSTSGELEFSHPCGGPDLWFLPSPLPHELRGLTNLGNTIVSLLGASPDLWFLPSPLPHELRGLTNLGNTIVSLLGASPDLWFLPSPLPHELRGLTNLGNTIVSLLGARSSNHQDHHRRLFLHRRRSSSQPPLITW
jgi:hypothetical protein